MVLEWVKRVPKHLLLTGYDWSTRDGSIQKWWEVYALHLQHGFCENYPPPQKKGVQSWKVSWEPDFLGSLCFWIVINFGNLAILCALFGMVKWPFQRLSDLQLGDQKVILNRLENIVRIESCLFGGVFCFLTPYHGTSLMWRLALWYSGKNLFQAPTFPTDGWIFFQHDSASPFSFGIQASSVKNSFRIVLLKWRALYIEWIFQVPIKGGRDYITPKRRQGLYLICMWYILPIGWLYTTYHPLQEPEKSIQYIYTTRKVDG